MIENHGIPLSATNAGTTSATATYAGTTYALVFITDVSISTTGTAGTSALYYSTTAGTTTMWSGAGANIYTSFQTPLRVPSGGTVTLIANGTTNTAANFSGFYIKTK